MVPRVALRVEVGGWGRVGGRGREEQEVHRSGSGTHVVVAWVRGWMLFNLSHLLALVCSPPTACARGHAAAAVRGLRKRPGLPSHPPPSPPPRGTRRGARLDLHPALLSLGVLLADPARRLPALAHTTHSSLPFRCSGVISSTRGMAGSQDGAEGESVQLVQ
jgi:hypothetical protein